MENSELKQDSKLFQNEKRVSSVLTAQYT